MSTNEAFSSHGSREPLGNFQNSLDLLSAAGIEVLEFILSSNSNKDAHLHQCKIVICVGVKLRLLGA